MMISRFSRSLVPNFSILCSSDYSFFRYTVFEFSRKFRCFQVIKTTMILLFYRIKNQISLSLGKIKVRSLLNIYSKELRYNFEQIEFYFISFKTLLEIGPLNHASFKLFNLIRNNKNILINFL